VSNEPETITYPRADMDVVAGKLDVLYAALVDMGNVNLAAHVSSVLDSLGYKQEEVSDGR